MLPQSNALSMEEEELLYCLLRGVQISGLPSPAGQNAQLPKYYCVLRRGDLELWKSDAVQQQGANVQWVTGNDGPPLVYKGSTELVFELRAHRRLLPDASIASHTCSLQSLMSLPDGTAPFLDIITQQGYHLRFAADVVDRGGEREVDRLVTAANEGVGHMTSAPIAQEDASTAIPSAARRGFHPIDKTFDMGLDLLTSALSGLSVSEALGDPTRELADRGHNVWSAVKLKMKLSPTAQQVELDSKIRTTGWEASESV